MTVHDAIEPQAPPQVTATVTVLHTGEVKIDQALAFREDTRHPMPYTGWFRPAAKQIWLPVSAYLVEHPRGTILVDTGWHEQMRTAQRSHLGLLAYTMYRGRLPEGQAIGEQLAARGLQPSDLDAVVLTHLHSDHASGLEHVAEARRLLVSQPEWDAREDVGYIPSMWEGIPLDAFELEEIPFGPTGRGLDLYGDGSIYLIHTPGHTKGHVAVLVATEEGWVLLAGDIGYAARSWTEQIMPGVTVDDDQMRASLAWVQAFAQREDCLAAVANHDPDIRPGPLGTAPSVSRGELGPGGGSATARPDR